MDGPLKQAGRIDSNSNRNGQNRSDFLRSWTLAAVRNSFVVTDFQVVVKSVITLKISFLLMFNTSSIEVWLSQCASTDKRMRSLYSTLWQGFRWPALLCELITEATFRCPLYSGKGWGATPSQAAGHCVQNIVTEPLEGKCVAKVQMCWCENVD